MLGVTAEDVRAVREELDCSIQQAAHIAQKRAALKKLNQRMAGDADPTLCEVVEWLVKLA